MTETSEHREQIHRSIEDIHRSLAAVSMKMAQLQLDAGEPSELAGAIEEGMTALGPLTERFEGLEAEYQMETNRMMNEGELEG